MADEVYSFEIAAEISKARKAIDSFAKDSQKNLDSINFNTTISAITDGFRLVGAIAKPAIDLIKNLGKEALAQALEAEKAQVHLANALRLTGDYSADAARDFDEYASEIQRTTTYTDDQVIASAALAKQFRLTNQETKQTIGVAVDLAARMGIDLDTATQKVAQTFNGFVDKSLVKVVPGLKNLSKEALASGAALDLIRGQVNGSAAALGDNFGGALQSAQNSFSEILETFGKFITQNPAIIAGIKEIRKGFDVFNDGLEANGDSIRGLITDGFLLLVSSVPLIIGAVRAIDGAFATLTATTKDILIYVTKLPTALLQAATGAGDAFDDLKNSLASVNDTVKFSERDKLYQPLIKGAEDLSDRVRKAALAAKQLNTVIAQGQSTSGKSSRLADIFPKEEMDKQIQQVKEAQQKIRDLTKGAIEAATKEPLQGVISFAITGQNELTKAKNEIDSTINAIKNSKDIPEALKAQAIGFAEEAKKGLSKAFSAAQAVGLVGNVVKGAEGAKKLVTSAIGAAADAIVPGIGGAVSEIAGELAQGPEHVRDMVKQFAAAVPDLVKNIALAAPVLIEEIVKAVPQIIKSLIAALPEIIDGIIQELPKLGIALALQAPTIAIAFIEGLINNTPKIVESFAKEFLKIPEQFAKALLDAINPLSSGDNGTLGTGGKGSGPLGTSGVARVGIGIATGGLSEVGHFLGLFAEGGTTPRNPLFSGDRANAKLSPNETVIDSELTDWLRQVKASGGNFGGGPREIKLYVGHQQFARAMYDSRSAGYQT